MKIKTSILLLLLALSINSLGQVNIMPNYSFEQYTNCELGNCTQNWVTNWYQPTLNGVNWCSFPCFGASNTEGVPSNLAGYQYARTGQCYAMVAMTESGSEYDYITGTLVDSLLGTKKYCITFYVSLGDSVWWAVSALGAYLSNDSVCMKSYVGVLPYTPQIENPATHILTNKIDWVPISGEYMANGGEKFITIGDFYSDTLSHFTNVGNGGIIWGWQTEVQTAYYIDDVSIRELTIAIAGKADTVCNGGGDSTLIGMNSLTNGVSFSWQPTTGLANPNAPQTMASPSATTTYTLTVTNDSILAVNNRGQACNCADSVTKDSVTVIVQTCAGISELRNKNNRINIYPNPSGGNFTLSMKNISDKPEIEVYNVLGEIVYMTKISSDITEISLSNEPEGIYFYRTFTETGKLLGSGKVIIEK